MLTFDTGNFLALISALPCLINIALHCLGLPCFVVPHDLCSYKYIYTHL